MMNDKQEFLSLITIPLKSLSTKQSDPSNNCFGFAIFKPYTMVMNQATDTEIVLFLQSGDPRQQESAFRQLYRNFFGLIESLVLSNAGTRDDAADIFHDGLIILFNNVKKGEFKLKSSIKTYLYSICRNLWLMKLRLGKRETPLEEKHESIQIQEDHFKTLEADEKKNLIVDLLKELNEDCRKILELYYFRKMKMEQIRTNLNLASEQVAKNKKSRCMKHIRSKVMQNSIYRQTLR